jgi:hypothetical protein
LIIFYLSIFAFKITQKDLQLQIRLLMTPNKVPFHHWFPGPFPSPKLICNLNISVIDTSIHFTKICINYLPLFQQEGITFFQVIIFRKMFFYLRNYFYSRFSSSIWVFHIEKSFHKYIYIYITDDIVWLFVTIVLKNCLSNWLTNNVVVFSIRLSFIATIDNYPNYHFHWTRWLDSRYELWIIFFLKILKNVTFC